MYEIPLFPLKTVLFPGMPLSLHIFEERYKQMMRQCLQEHIPFGVVLIQHGEEVGAPAQPHVVGCTARVTHVQPLEDGRMNLLAVGQDRFRILSLKHDKPFLVGVVEILPLQVGDPAALAAETARLRPLVERYLGILAQANQIEYRAEQLPDEAEKFAFLAAALLQMPAAKKQALLHFDSDAKLLSALRACYLEELAVLKALLKPQANDLETGPFSLN